jgi:SAM-dependent methyltransferase
MNDENSSSPGCPLCQTRDILPFMRLEAVPVQCTLLWSGLDAARRAPRGEIWLGFCPSCGHIFNLSFDSSLVEYTYPYETSCHNAPCFQAYYRALADQLVRRYELYGKEAVEIGAANGEFVAMLCELGENRGTSFDPGSRLAAGYQAADIGLVKDFFSEEIAGRKPDFVCCRRMLEYLPQPNELLASIRRLIGSRLQAVVFFEVPNVLFTLRRLAIWDITYDYYSYFSPRSLVHLVRQHDFELLAVAETFGGQFLVLEAIPGAEARPLPDSRVEEQERRCLQDGLAAFAGQYRDKVALWRRRLERFQARRQRVVLWGVDSRAVTFLNALEAVDSVHYVVDRNLGNQDRYVAGTGQRVVAPEFLRSYRPHVVISINANCHREIRQQLQAMGLTASTLIAG